MCEWGGLVACVLFGVVVVSVGATSEVVVGAIPELFRSDDDELNTTPPTPCLVVPAPQPQGSETARDVRGVQPHTTTQETRA